jgi:hypothetical protein
MEGMKSICFESSEKETTTLLPLTIEAFQEWVKSMLDVTLRRLISSMINSPC